MNYIKLLRVKHYVKNFLIFMPLFFSGLFLDRKLCTINIIAFFTFSFLSSSIYIINDIRDVEKDRLHEVKKKRPIASGEISITKAMMIALFLLVISFALNFTIFCNFDLKSILCLLTYFIINLLYSFGMKNKPIIDVIILSAGFLLRVIYGGIVGNVIVSNWLYLTVLAFSLYMGLGKRRNELNKQQTAETRGVLKFYSYEFLDKNMYMCLALGLMFYSMWTVNVDNNVGNNLIWTVPVVISITMKYNLIVEGDTYGDPVDVLLSDKIMLSLVLMYAVLVTLILYGKNILGFFI